MKTTVEKFTNSHRYKKFIRENSTKNWNDREIQRRIVFEQLFKNFQKEVPLTKIIVIDNEIIAQYNTRLFELRHNYWFDIVNRTETVFDEKKQRNVKHSFYTLEWLN